MRFVIVALTIGLAFGATTAFAYGSFDGCKSCHQNFKGPGQAIHDLHNTFITNCRYCHKSIGDTPLTNSSGLDAAHSCNGCHVQKGTVGRHRASGSSNCSPCHDGVVADGVENVAPFYYGTAATSLTDPCADNIDNDGDLLTDGLDGDCTQTPVEDASWTILKQIYGN